MLYTAYHSSYNHSILPEGHRFPMIKYDLLRRQLVHQGIVTQEAFVNIENVADGSDILRAHTPNYLLALNNLNLSKIEERRTGFPLSKMLIDREKTIMQGGIVTSELAYSNNTVSMNIAGGTHHAYSYRGEGFCLLNDIAIAAHYLIANYKLSKILVIDLDVHQGNGTAEIFASNDKVFTFSMHAKSNFPFQKEQSDLDVALSDGIGDEEYLHQLSISLDHIFSIFKPEFVFYQCGVDVLESDKLGKLSMSVDGCRRRDKLVFERVRNENIGMHCCMGGGYSPDINIIVDAHTNTFKEALNYI